MPCGKEAICKLDQVSGAPNCTCQKGYLGNPKVECLKGITFIFLTVIGLVLIFDGLLLEIFQKLMAI